MKKHFLPLLFATLWGSSTLFAQTDSIATDSLLTYANNSSGFLGISDWTPVFEVIMYVILSILLLAMIVHMIYNIFFVSKKYQPLSLGTERQKRQQEGLNTISPQEVDYCFQLMENLTAQWTPAP